MGDDQRNFLFLWILMKILCYSLGAAYVSGNPCDITNVTECYTDLVHYESLAFPLYGKNESKLDENCGNINMAYYCVEEYAENCQENSECDEDCREILRDMRSFTVNSGLKEFANDLCSEGNALRLTYLENVDCLETNADLYAACHNDSQKSQHYLMTSNSIEERCCYFTWYDGCFKNATMYRCGENATFFVSFALHRLVGHISDAICHGVPITCDRPPLPPEDGELDMDKPDQTNNEIDNKIDKNSMSPTIHSCVTGGVMLSYLFVMLFKYFL